MMGPRISGIVEGGPLVKGPIRDSLGIGKSDSAINPRSLGTSKQNTGTLRSLYVISSTSKTITEFNQYVT